MGSNYNAFSPNSSSGISPYSAEFNITAGDALFELQAFLCLDVCVNPTPGCSVVSDNSEVIKKPLDLEGYQSITLYIKYLCDNSLIGEILGSPVAPFDAGNAIFLFPVGFFDEVSGDVVGELEVMYQDGRIITSVDYVKFNVISDYSGHGRII